MHILAQIIIGFFVAMLIGLGFWAIYFEVFLYPICKTVPAPDLEPPKLVLGNCPSAT